MFKPTIGSKAASLDEISFIDLYQEHLEKVLAICYAHFAHASQDLKSKPNHSSR